MRLYIVRHGEAESQAETDAERALTDRGQSAIRLLWQQLVDEGVSPRQVICSPYRRAHQTARIIRTQTHIEPETREASWLRPDTDPGDALHGLQDQNHPDHWVLVSHMPLVALLTGLLTGERPEQYAFPVGNVACLEMNQLAAGKANLTWTRN